jgi:hypothetical protein
MTAVEKKAEMNYRPAEEGEIRCQSCEFSRFMQILGWKLQSFGMQWRCFLIGLGCRKENKIGHNYTCNEATPRSDVERSRDGNAV